MYTAALEFLEDERDAWRPYEALLALTDAQLERPTPPDGPGLGWSGRVLVAHIVGWLEHVLEVARELAVGERSPTREAAAADWAARGDAINDELHAAWAALPIGEVRRRLETVPGELRGTLTVVPESRWLKDPRMQAFFLMDTVEHYEEHRPQLDAVLASAREAGG
jgi:hypothetical protein